MAITVHCDIVSAEEELFSGLVEMVIAHGHMGDIGVLPGHAPLLSTIKAGAVRLKMPPKKQSKPSHPIWITLLLLPDWQRQQLSYAPLMSCVKTDANCFA